MGGGEEIKEDVEAENPNESIKDSVLISESAAARKSVGASPFTINEKIDKIKADFDASSRRSVFR